MTYINTYTPRVAMPRNEARVTATPKTEQEYARMLDALCRKEGKKGAVPNNDHSGTVKTKFKRDFTGYLNAIRSGYTTVASLSSHMKIQRETVRYIVDMMKDRGIVKYNKSKRQWEIV